MEDDDHDVPGAGQQTGQASGRSGSREERRRRTAALLREAAQTDDEQRRKDLLDEVVTLNIEVARALARRYRDRGVPLEDLEQVACLALVRAVQGFDPGQENDLLTFAVPSIRGELKKHFRDCGWLVRPPRRVQQVQTDVFAVAGDLDHPQEGDPTAAQIAELLGLELTEVQQALAARSCFRGVSLDAPLDGESGSCLADLLPADGSNDPEELVDALVTVAPLIRDLDERDRLLLHLRYVRECTQQEIGDHIGATQMQVSRLLSRLLRRLRDAALAEEPAGRTGERLARAS